MAAREQFSHDEVVKRTARRLGTNDTRVRDFLDAYATEYISHARETENVERLRPQPRITAETPHEAPAKATPAKATGKAPRKATTPRKAPAKATSPAKGQGKAQGDSAGTGSALIDAQLRREAESSVELDRDQTHVVGERIPAAE